METKLNLLKEENSRLQRSVRELSILNDLAREIGASNNTEQVMEKIINRSIAAVGASQGDISLVDREALDHQTLIRGMVSTVGQQTYHLAENLTGWMFINKIPLLINNPALDDRFSGVEWPETVRSILCVPLMIKAELIGVLTVYNKKNSAGFNNEDERLLAIIAAQSAQIVENARLYEEEKELIAVKEDLKLSARIQEELQPKENPDVEGYDIAGSSVPAKLVGGDYFDFIKTTEVDLAVCLGDISGKGMAAALLMANLQATIRGQTLIAHKCSEITTNSNTLIFRSTPQEKYATFFFCALDSKTDSLLYSNAGHNPPLLFRAGNKEAELLSTGGMPLGIMGSFSYQEERVDFNPGDLLVIYSDGVTEAMNSDEEEFELDHLVESVIRHRSAPAEELIKKIFSAVTAHVKNAPQFDDMTLVVVKRIEP